MIRITRDQSFRVVCNIRTPINVGETVGTGIFIAKDNKCYLVSAAHVAVDTNSNSYIVVCDSNNNPIPRKLTQLNNTINWIYHPVEDIAVLEIDVANNMDIMQSRCFPYEQIEFNPKNISRDVEITCVGFPNGLGVSGKFSPFTFRTYASSSEIQLNRADTHTSALFICLENPSVGGYSGGPIFDLGIMVVGVMTSNSGPTRLLGIMHGTISDNTGGKIAAISPACFIKDII